MDVLLIEFAAEMLSFSSSYHLVDTTVTWTGEEIQKVSWHTKRRGAPLLFISPVVSGTVLSAGTLASGRSGFS
ncbi:hypothetical protein CXF51_04860 [Bacillus subtilis subsp. subtilis]|nr:hypothetical protein CXF51_04860 [Bacillus subtilis subsp. subtilis]